MYSDDRSFVELFVDVMYDPIEMGCVPRLTVVGKG